MQIETLIWFIPLPPILAFLTIVLWANRDNRLSHIIAVGSMIVSWGLAMVVFFNAVTIEGFGHNPFHSSIEWMPTGETALRIGV
ncbi:MAG TPA: hypothetical protein VMX56_00350, partial [Anaerolineales bacterium]|nr:hypothetical protein [Anaerolineales bacterium]